VPTRQSRSRRGAGTSDISHRASSWVGGRDNLDGEVVVGSRQGNRPAGGGEGSDSKEVAHSSMGALDTLAEIRGDDVSTGDSTSSDSES
jgi:hypothetical protein